MPLGYDVLRVMLTLLQLAVIVLLRRVALRLRWSVCDTDFSPVGCDWSARGYVCPEAMMVCV